MAVFSVSFARYGGRLALNYLRGQAGLTQPPALYVALLTGTMTTNDDIGTGFTEFTGYNDTNNTSSSLTRPVITFNAAADAGASGTLLSAQRITSSNAPTFAITSTPGSPISAIAITTTQTKGTALDYSTSVIWFGELTTGIPPSQSATTVSVVATDTLTFSAGNITIDLY